MSKRKAPSERGHEPWGVEYRTLPVALTPAEIQARGKELAQTMVSAYHLEEELAAHAAEIKGRLKSMAGDARRLARVIASGTEERSVECEVFKRLESRAYQVVRKDTGEIVFERELTEEEELALRQQALPGVEAVQ